MHSKKFCHPVASTTPVDPNAPKLIRIRASNYSLSDSVISLPELTAHPGSLVTDGTDMGFSVRSIGEARALSWDHNDFSSSSPFNGFFIFNNAPADLQNFRLTIDHAIGSSVSVFGAAWSIVDQDGNNWEGSDRSACMAFPVTDPADYRIAVADQKSYAGWFAASAASDNIPFNPLQAVPYSGGGITKDISMTYDVSTGTNGDRILNIIMEKGQTGETTVVSNAVLQAAVKSRSTGDVGVCLYPGGGGGNRFNNKLNLREILLEWD